MRRLLILFVLFFFVGSLVYAGWPFSKKTEPRFDAAALQKTLKSLAPTEAEKTAISQFRKDALKQHTLANVLLTPKTVNSCQEDQRPTEAGFLNGAEAPIANPGSGENANPIQTVSYNAEVPPSFDPDGPQISTEFRFLSADTPVVKTILAEKSLQWSGMPAPRKKSERTYTFGLFSTVSETQSLPLVRFLDKEHAEAFVEIFQSNTRANVLQAPKITIFSGHTGEIRDTCESVYATGILPFETEGNEEEIDYQPTVQTLEEGMRITTTATLLESGACSIKMNVELSRIEDDVDNYTIAEETHPNTKDTKAGTMIFAPKLTKTTVSIPSIDVPENMSALFALPGAKTVNGQEMFLMVTPKRVQ